MADGFVEIIGAITQPINTLIEKASSAIGILYEPIHRKKIAKADIEIDKMKLLSSLELNDIENRAVKRLIYVESKRQKNIEKVLELSANNLSDQAKPENIDNDWLFHFFDLSKNVSNHDFQLLWAKILSGECEKAGSYSKKLLNILSVMTQSDAESFRTLCDFGIKVNKDDCLFVARNLDGVYKENKIDFNSLLRLDSLGLITLYSGAFGGYGIPLNDNNNRVVIEYKDRKPTILKRLKNDEDEFIVKSLTIGNCVYTHEGSELSEAIETSGNDEFYTFLTRTLSQMSGFELVDE